MNKSSAYQWRIGCIFLLITIFIINWFETTHIEPMLNQTAESFEYAEIFLNLERSLGLNIGPNFSYDFLASANRINFIGYSLVYYFGYALLFTLMFIILFFRTDVSAFRTLTFAIVINYLICLVFFLTFPIPEKWTYPTADTYLLSDLWSTGLIENIRPFSGIDNCFPSFHTSSSVTAITVAYLFQMKFRYAIYCFGTTVMISTIILGIHWYPDMIAGTIVGVFSAQLGYHLNQRILTRADVDRR